MPLKIDLLIVDDNPADRFLIKEFLADSDILTIKFFEASSLDEAFQVLDNSQIDIILLDMYLPDSSGINTFYSVFEKYKDSGIIVLSGLTDKQIAYKTVKSGAQDFLLKGEFDDKILEKSILYSVERKKNLRLLEESEQKYKALFDVSPLPLFIVKIPDQKIIRVNKEAEKVFKYSESEFQERALNQLLSENYTDFLKNYWKSDVTSFQSAVRAKNKRKVPLNVSVKPITISEEDFLLVQMEDISEKINFEKNKQLIINEIQDNERRNFAMELHDGLAQELVLLNIYIDQLKDPNKNNPDLEQAKTIINDAIRHTRRLTYNLSPPLLDEGFLKGLSVLFERFNDVNDMSINLQFNLLNNNSNLEAKNISEEVSYNAFRIIQEFLNNSIKHAEASTITAVVSEKKTHFNIHVSDNGKGFNQNTSRSAGMGIHNMRQRAKLFEIHLEIESIPDKGTSISLQIPKSSE
ncbi:MAG: response regulator [Brumimicrobium sp.]|nr:response regulator [Brumimicrobium sp.]